MYCFHLQICIKCTQQIFIEGDKKNSLTQEYFAAKKSGANSKSVTFFLKHFFLLIQKRTKFCLNTQIEWILAVMLCSLHYVRYNLSIPAILQSYIYMCGEPQSWIIESSFCRCGCCFSSSSIYCTLAGLFIV